MCQVVQHDNNSFRFGEIGLFTVCYSKSKKSDTTLILYLSVKYEATSNSLLALLSTNTGNR